MTLLYADNTRLEEEKKTLETSDQPFAVATVVRTLNATSAKPGDKALLDEEGNILVGWLGGGCVRGAIGTAAREAISSGTSQFVSLLPPELLEEKGITAGQMRDGVKFARNGCPSKGTMDIFVEPILPLPKLIIFGSRAVADCLADLGQKFDFSIERCGADASAIDPSKLNSISQNYIVVATQGEGDFACLRAALNLNFSYLSFVGSAKKFESLTEKLVMEDPDLAAQLKDVYAPAGLSIHAITPDEIALSILAQITNIRRSKALSKEGADD